MKKRNVFVGFLLRFTARGLSIGLAASVLLPFLLALLALVTAGDQRVGVSTAAAGLFAVLLNTIPIGVGAGLLLGFSNGLVLGLVSQVGFNPPGDELIYRLVVYFVVAAVTLLCLGFLWRVIVFNPLEEPYQSIAYPTFGAVMLVAVTTAHDILHDWYLWKDDE